MAKLMRKVVKIDEELCNGCGQCTTACAEGAIELIDGKAKLVSDVYCDGLGACLGECPQGAITIEEREADEFDARAVAERLGHAHAANAAITGGCPGSRTLDFRSDAGSAPSGDRLPTPSELRQWPVKIRLVNPAAPYFAGAHLVVAADCTAFAYGSFHPDFLKGKALAIGCPKFDNVEFYKDKIKAIIEEGGVERVTVLIMEVPCCLGLLYAVREAIRESGRDVPLESLVVSVRGEVEPQTA